MSIKVLMVSILIKVFGNYWFLFISYMLFNILDWITGSLKAVKLKELSSYLGIKGLIKKLGYWVVIGIAFSFSSMFVIIGEKILNINLSIMYSLGWFTFVLLMVNEATSILENLVALHVKVPNILLKSLKATDNMLDNVSEKLSDKDLSENSKEDSNE